MYAVSDVYLWTAVFWVCLIGLAVLTAGIVSTVSSMLFDYVYPRIMNSCGWCQRVYFRRQRKRILKEARADAMREVKQAQREIEAMRRRKANLAGGYDDADKRK